MTEDDARRATLLQAFESAQPPSPLWGDADRAWATRLALAQGEASAEAFVARRAQHAMQRLAPRDPALAKWARGRAWAAQAVAWAALGGLLVGGMADSIGSGQRINLLAPPLWGLLAWNAVVYIVLLGHGMARLLVRPTRPTRLTRPGLLRRLAERALRLGRGLAGTEPVAGAATPMQVFTGLWLPRSAPLAGARAAVVLHVAAAALALGLVGGMYLRGLVLDYRAGWESTFVTGPVAHAAVSTLLAPAAAVSGIAITDAAAFEALRGAHGSASPGEPAAPWIHLFALTLIGFVVLPRALLAALGAARAGWLARRMALPMGEPYFQRLERQQLGDVARVVVRPYAGAVDEQTAPRLQSLLGPVLGDGLVLGVDPVAAFGAEDSPIAAPAPGTTHLIALFELAATPEPEVHGRYARALAAAAPAGAATLLLVDESAFRRRFGADSARLAQRRDAWRVFAEALATLPVFIDLDAPDAAAVQRGVQLALRSPVAPPAP